MIRKIAKSLSHQTFHHKVQGKKDEHRFGVELKENKQFHHTKTGSSLDRCNKFHFMFLHFYFLIRGRRSQTRLLRTHSGRQKIFDALCCGRQRLPPGSAPGTHHCLSEGRRRRAEKGVVCSIVQRRRDQKRQHPLFLPGRLSDWRRRRPKADHTTHLGEG